MSQMVPVGAPYFVAHFDEGPQLFVRIRGRFPLQFGRCVFQMVSESLFFPSSLLDSLLSSNPSPSLSHFNILYSAQNNFTGPYCHL